jgi:ribonuclease HI
MKPEVIIYCDGSADKEGHGGAAAILLGKRGKVREVFQPYTSGATNQKMEILAAMIGLSYLTYEGVKVRIISDSKYVTDCYNKGWIDDWKRKGWRKGSRREVMNIEQWKSLDAHVQLQVVEFVWVKGHSGDEYNEKCDLLANYARERARRFAMQEEYRALITSARARRDDALTAGPRVRRRATV